MVNRRNVNSFLDDEEEKRGLFARILQGLEEKDASGTGVAKTL